MAAKPAPTKRRRRRRGPKPVGWFRGLRDHLVSVYVGQRHRVRGSDVAGYRVVRVLRAKVDRPRRQVVELVVRLYGGREDTNQGYNGPRVVLDDRREFAGHGLAFGVLAGRRTIPIDAYYASLLQR